MWILLLSLSDEGTGYTGGRINESAEASRGTCHYNDGANSLLMSVSREKGQEGRSA